MSMRMIATLCLAIALCSAAARAGRADEFGRVEQGSAATRTAWTMPENVRELLLRRGHQVFDPVLHTSPRASPRLRAAAKAATATTAGPHVATQQDDAQLSVLLNIVKNGLQGNAPSANIGIIGAGVAGLAAAIELRRVGHNVTILESSNRPGGRIKTARGESFSGDMYAEKGAMRLPCAHWLTHAYVLRYGLEKRPFHTYNEEAMFFFEGLGRPYPKKYFDPDSSSFNQTLLNMLLDAYNITNANERVWSGKLFDTTMQQFVDDVTASGNWTKYIALFDGYSNREFLQSRGWSDGAIRMWAVTQNVETIINFDFLETFRDYVGMWFSDACVFNFPSPDPNGLFTGLPTQGLWELVGGTDVLTTAMFRDVQDNVLFGHRVIAIDRSLNTSVRVTYEVNGVYTSSMSFDYLLVSVPFSALRHIIVTPPFSDGKRLAVRTAHYMPSTKVLLQYRERFWERPNPMIPPPFSNAGILPGRGGGTYTDLPLRTLFYPAHPPNNTRRGVILASYSWEDEAGTWASIPMRQRLANAHAYVRMIHGPMADEYLEVGESEAWSTDEYAMGAFLYFQPGQFNELHDRICAPEGRIRFIGEHASYAHTWIQGALWSALRESAAIQQELLSNPVLLAQAAPVYFPTSADLVPINWSNGMTQAIFCMQGVLWSRTVVPPNVNAVAHSHPEEQFGTVIAGSMTVVMSGITRLLNAGDSYHAPSMVFHNVTAGASGSTVIEILSPARSTVCGAQSAPLPVLISGFTGAAFPHANGGAAAAATLSTASGSSGAALLGVFDTGLLINGAAARDCSRAGSPPAACADAASTAQALRRATLAVAVTAQGVQGGSMAAPTFRAAWRPQDQVIPGLQTLRRPPSMAPLLALVRGRASHAVCFAALAHFESATVLPLTAAAGAAPATMADVQGLLVGCAARASDCASDAAVAALMPAQCAAGDSSDVFSLTRVAFFGQGVTVPTTLDAVRADSLGSVWALDTASIVSQLVDKRVFQLAAGAAPPPPPPAGPSSSGGGRSGAVVAAAVVCSLLGSAAIAGLAYYYLRKSRAAARGHDDEAIDSSLVSLYRPL